MNTKRTWYLQIQDENYSILCLNHPVGEYVKYNKWLERAVDKIVAQFPEAKRWEVRVEPYTNRVMM